MRGTRAKKIRKEALKLSIPPAEAPVQSVASGETVWGECQMIFSCAYELPLGTVCVPGRPIVPGSLAIFNGPADHTGRAHRVAVRIVRVATLEEWQQQPKKDTLVLASNARFFYEVQMD